MQSPDPYFEQGRTRIDAFLDRVLPPENRRPAVIHRAMRYSVFAGGKRFRPLLCFAAAEACGSPADVALAPAAALELLHTYTLIHDDLPAMDNDDLRRGQPTCHRAFGEANAILAGDALLTLAFGVLAGTDVPPPRSVADLIHELAAAGGSEGVIGGQAEDMAHEGQALSEEALTYIHTHKTGDLIRASVRLGAMAAGARDETLSTLTGIADAIGLAFQIADDLLNATGDAGRLGKATGTDEARGKQTFVALYGIEESKARARTLIDDATRALDTLPGHTDPMARLAGYTIERFH